jgi:hypothetical protein
MQRPAEKSLDFCRAKLLWIGTLLRRPCPDSGISSSATWSVVHVQCAATCADSSLIGVEHTPIVVARAFTLWERTPDFVEWILSFMRRTPRLTTLVRDVGALIPDVDALDPRV